MAGVLKLLQYQLIDYWRRAFYLRGRYDRSAGFMLLVILGFAVKYATILAGAAKSFSNGGTENAYLLLAIVFLAWFLPALESQSISVKTKNFLHLPLTKTQFASINLAAVFLLPTSIIPVVVSLAAVYPLTFSKNVPAGVIALFIFSLLSAFIMIAFFNLLKIKLFRLAVFPASIILAYLFFNGHLSFNPESPFFSQIADRNVNPENPFGNIFVLGGCLAASLLLAFFTVRHAVSASLPTGRKLYPQLLSRIRLPVRFGELLKKDFIYSWLIMDCWLALLAAVFYVVILSSASFSFESFSIALAVIVMLDGSLAFNNFGLENISGIERLSLFPIAPSDLIATKNKAFALVVGSQTFFILPLLFFKFGVILSLMAILKTSSIILLYTAWGNSLSIRFPFKMNFYQLSFGGSIPLMLYGVFAISLLIIVPEFLTIEKAPAKLIYNLLLTGLSFIFYKISLQRSATRLPENWENIALRLS